ncbi:putative RNA-directed DNA polymerase [Helianthus annuus]|nr:putative RNA-directed DNA polymerase [Helianthus annuus]
MNYLCVNIRGMGVEGKDEWVRGMKKKYDISFVAMQETKTRDLDRLTIGRFWGNGDFEFDVSDPVGLSGGMVSVWDPTMFLKTSVQKNRQYLMISGRLKENNVKVNIINVYGPQNNAQKRLLWQELRDKMRDHDGWWIFLGDFNTVRSPKERKNTIFNVTSAMDLNSFIDEAGLVEYVMKGRKYTFLAGKGTGNKQSKIDRVLVCMDMFNKWPEACLRAFPRGLSDHCPLVLNMVNKKFGPKPFRWFNSWGIKEGCIDVVRKALGIHCGKSKADQILHYKLQNVRRDLRKWRDI